MSDDARMQRLTELARKVWPDLGPVFFSGIGVDGFHSSDGDTILQVSDVGYARALDALEAALLVLADETSLRALERAGLPRSVVLSEAEWKLAQVREWARDWFGDGPEPGHEGAEALFAILASEKKC